VDADDLIQALAADAAPVRRLAHPMTRAVIWLALSAAYVAAVVVAYAVLGSPVMLSGDGRFLVEQLATIATALTAALAAFCCIVPGRSRLIALLPMVPLVVWLASVGEACAKTWHLVVSGGLAIDGGGWDCVPPSVLIGLGPAILMLAMLRRGAPLYPRATVALGALAAAALGNLGLRLFHEGDVTIVMLVWQLAAMTGLTALAGLIGPRILAWRLLRLNVEGTG
jgi:hypothetical protein